MPTQIVKVEPAKLDPDCMQVTLRVLPSRLQKLLGHSEQLVVYKGQGSHWYRYPCFTPAPSKLAKFLKSIYRGWEFRHIQYQFKQVGRKAG